MLIYLRLSLDFLTCTVPSGATRTVLPRMVDSSSSTTVKCLGFFCFNFGAVTALDGPEIHKIIDKSKLSPMHIFASKLLIFKNKYISNKLVFILNDINRLF